MEETKTTSRANLDSILWALILILFGAAVFANYYFVELAWSLRLALWIILACVLVSLAAFTTQGKRIWAFSKDARMELRKVVWPTRDETVKTTGIIAVLVFVMSLILWAVDSVLLWLVGWITK